MKSKLFLLNKESRKGSLSLDETRMQPGSDQEGSSRKWYKQVATLLLLLLILCVGNAWGDTYTWTAATGDQNLFGLATTVKGKVILNGKTWSFTRTGANNLGFENSCVQFGKNGGVEEVVLSTNTIPGTITNVSVTCASYNAKHTCKIEVGGTTVKTATATASGSANAAAISTGTISKTGEVKITFAKTSSARAMYIKSISITYTPGSYNVDWYVGDTRTKQETSVTVGTPPTVADNALGGDCSTLKFLGWSETNVGSTPSSAPSDLFASEDAPALSANKTYYAVFGNLSYTTTDSILIQTHRYDSWTYSGTTTNKTTYRLFGNGAYVSSTAFRLEGLQKVIVCGGTFGGSQYNGLAVQDESGNSWKTGTVSSDSKTKPNTLSSGSSLTGRKAIRVSSTSGNGTSTGVGISRILIFTSIPGYSNCVTSCAAGSTPVTGVTVSPTSKAIIVGQTFTITPTVAPAGATDKTVSWTSSATSKATVTSAGVVTGVAAGTSTITCTTTDGGYTATCSVTVRSITLQAQDEDGNAIGVGGPGAPTFTAATGTITAAANTGNYVFKQWSVTNATAVSTTTTPTTISSPTGNVTVTAVYYKPITITYKANGSTFTTQTYGYNGTLAFPASNPDGATYSCTGKTFVGWVGEANKDYSNASTPPTYATDGGSVTAAATYYAVFATSSGGGSTNVTLYPSSFTDKGTNSYGSGAERTATVSSISFGGHYITGNPVNSPYNPCDCADTYLMCKANDATIYNKSELFGNITKVVVNQYSAKDISLYCGTSQLMASDNTSTGQTPSGTKITDVDAATSMTWNVSGSYTYFALKKGGNASYVTSIVITYSSVTYTNYTTTCCAPWDNPTVTYASTTLATGGSATAAPTITGTTHGTLSFSSDNTSVATVNSSTGAVTPSASCPGTANITAHWTAADGYCEKDVVIPFTVTGDVTITFNANGGTGSMSSQVISYNTATALNANTFTHATKTFAGWNTAADGSGTRYTDGQSVQLTTNVTLYAQWLVLYTITFDNTNGPDVASVKQTTEGGKVTLPTASPSDACVDEGWAFVGWKNGSAQSSTSSLPDGLIPAGKYTPEGSATFYAVYKLRSGGTDKTDELTNTLIGAGNSYEAWSGKSATNSGHSTAVYAGLSAGGNSAIQLRGKNNSGIITTTSGGIATKVVVTWNENTEDGRIIQVYGKNSAYSATSDLYANATHGTLLGLYIPAGKHCI